MTPRAPFGDTAVVLNPDSRQATASARRGSTWCRAEAASIASVTAACDVAVLTAGGGVKGRAPDERNCVGPLNVVTDPSSPISITCARAPLARQRTSTLARAA